VSKIFTLTRKFESPHGTFGRLEGPGLSLYTAELPWRDNKRKLSRILPGTYRVRPYSGSRFKNVYRLEDVPGREAILIHSGNYAGDVTQGFLSHVEGCILVGTGAGILRGQQAVTGSREAMNLLRAYIGKDGFILEIIDEFQG
jgi:hypothetical protein